MSRACTITASVTILGFVMLLAVRPVMARDWPSYGGGPGGQRYSTANRINADNVGDLAIAWTFHTGELGANLARRDKLTFEATPILIGRTLYFTTATSIVFAVDAITGTERWRYDAKINRGVRYSEMSSRGVSYWADSQHAGEVCGQRILFGTLDARLIALDARTGRPCADFGQGGFVDLSKGVRLQSKPDYAVTSPPAVIGDTVVVGSSIGDNRATNLELGVVRAFDVHTGALRWHWDPIPRGARIPRDAANPNFDEVAAQNADWTGAANAWSVLSVSPRRISSSCPPAPPVPIFSAASVSVRIAGRIPWSRSTPPPGSSCGASRSCITISGTTTSRRNLSSRAHARRRTRARRDPGDQDRTDLRLRARYRPPILFHCGKTRTPGSGAGRASVSDAAGLGDCAARALERAQRGRRVGTHFH